MFNGYRCIVFAVGLILAAHHPHIKANTEQRDRNERVSHSLENITAINSNQPEWTHGLPESQPCDPGDDKRDSDLCAQWKAADAAADAAWWASAGTLISGVSGFFVVIALFLAFQSNRIAQTTAHAQLRPYVHADGVHWEKRLDNGEEFIDFSIKFRNAGQTPAEDVQVGAFLYLTEPNSPFPNINIILKAGEDKQPLGPNSSLSVAASHSITDSEANDVWTGKKDLFICGIAIYRDRFSDINRRTTCHYQIRLGKDIGQFSYIWWTHVGNLNKAT